MKSSYYITNCLPSMGLYRFANFPAWSALKLTAVNSGGYSDVPHSHAEYQEAGVHRHAVPVLQRAWSGDSRQHHRRSTMGS